MAQPALRRPEAAHDIPPLVTGDLLTRAEFERRSALHPEIKKAELIDGMVFTEVSVGARHGEKHADLLAWLVLYRSRHRHVQVLDNTTVRLSGGNSLQPDALLRVLEGGTSRLNDDGVVEGPPELIVEIAVSSVSYDMHLKKEAYRRGGVREYVVWQEWENQLSWFVLEDDHYVDREPGEHGIIESEQFPGLRLNVPALLAGEIEPVLAALD